MIKPIYILSSAKKKQNEAMDKLYEIYECQDELDLNQRKKILEIINSQINITSSIENLIASLK
jgi:hypothetical protein